MTKYTFGILVLAIFTIGCVTKRNNNVQKTLIVTISPIKYIVGQIVGKDFRVEVLVPDGASPETYEPTPQQIISMAQSDAIFTTGLIDFEQELTSRLTNQPSLQVVNLSQGIAVIKGECGHDEHEHGVDPHIWTSPKQLKIMAKNAYDAIALLYPDSSKYKEAYLDLDQKLSDLDFWITEKVSGSSLPYFIIYHPAMTYYAHDYGIKQVSLEVEGKEPTAESIKTLVSNAKGDGIKYIFYQKQFNKSTVETIAQEIGAEIIEIDPLKEDVINNLKNITLMLCR